MLNIPEIVTYEEFAADISTGPVRENVGFSDENKHDFSKDFYFVFIPLEVAVIF